MTRKILSSVICLLIAASTVFAVSCADKTGSTSTNKNNGTGTTPPGSTPTDNQNEIDPELLKLNFAEDEETPTEVVFAFSESGETEENFTLRSIEPDDSGDERQDTVSAALIERNTVIESTFGVDIIAEEASKDIQGLQSTISTQMSAMDDYIDVIVGYQYYDLSMATQGWLMNLADLKDDDGTPIDYIHYDTKDYWGSNYIDALSYKNIVYWVTGDLSLRYTGGMYCTFVNKKLYTQNLEKDYGDIFELVQQGKWTIDLMAEMAAKVYVDDGDLVLNETDIFGYGYETNDSFDALAIGSMVPYSTKTADSIAINFASQKTVDFVGKLERLVHGSSSLGVGDKDSTIILPIFQSGNCVFTINKIFKAESAKLTEMADDFYIVPVPKYDEAQANYVTLLHDGCSVYAISAFSNCKRAAAATLEYMAYLSHKDIRPLYYDQALKNKYTQDPNSAQMIDLIHENITTDFVMAWSQSIKDIAHWFRSYNKTVGFKRQLDKHSTEWNNALDELLQNLKDNAEF